MTKKYQAPIVKKAFLILKAISKSSQGLRISEIATTLDISKSTVHGITAALEDQGALIRSPNSKRYVIGTTLMTLGKAAYERMDFKQTARPFMEQLMVSCRETVFLGVRNRDKVIVVDVAAPEKDFKITSPIGTSLPLLAGAVGKIFLSAMDTDQAREYLKEHPLNQFTPNTIIDPDAYLSGLRTVRQTKVAFDDEEYITGVRGVAAGLNPQASYTPAIWVAGFTTGMGDKKITTIMDQVCSAAKAINQAMDTGL